MWEYLKMYLLSVRRGIFSSKSQFFPHLSPTCLNTIISTNSLKSPFITIRVTLGARLFSSVIFRVSNYTCFAFKSRFLLLNQDSFYLANRWKLCVFILFPTKTTPSRIGILLPYNHVVVTTTLQKWLVALMSSYQTFNRGYKWELHPLLWQTLMIACIFS